MTELSEIIAFCNKYVAMEPWEIVLLTHPWVFDEDDEPTWPERPDWFKRLRPLSGLADELEHGKKVVR